MRGDTTTVSTGSAEGKTREDNRAEMRTRGGGRLERRTVPRTKAGIHRARNCNAGSRRTIRSIRGKEDAEGRMVGGQRNGGATNSTTYCHRPSSEAR